MLQYSINLNKSHQKHFISHNFLVQWMEYISILSKSWNHRTRQWLKVFLISRGQAGSAAADCQGHDHLVSVSPRRETPTPLWATCPNVWPYSQWEYLCLTFPPLCLNEISSFTKFPVFPFVPIACCSEAGHHW